MVQIPAAFEYACANPPTSAVAFVLAETAVGKRGVCMRDCAMDSTREESFVLRVQWPESATAADKTAFMMQLQLSCDVPWIEFPPAISKWRCCGYLAARTERCSRVCSAVQRGDASVGVAR